MREPEWRDYSDFGEWVDDHDAWKRAETYGVSDITGPDDARRRIDARFEDLDTIEWPGRTQQARGNERRLVEAIMLDMSDRASIYAYPSKRYLSRVSGMATSPVYRVFQRVMTIPGLFRWVRKPEYRKQGKIRLRVGEAGPAAGGRRERVDVNAGKGTHDLGPDVDPWSHDLGPVVDPGVGLRSGSLRTSEPNPYPIPNVMQRDIHSSTSAELDQASNFFPAPVPFAASGGSENTGPEEPLQLGDKNEALALTPLLVPATEHEQPWTLEATFVPGSSVTDNDEVSELDIFLAELMFGSSDEVFVSYVREHRP